MPWGLCMADIIYKIFTAVGFAHPMHPILVHITIGSVVAAFIFALLGLITKRNELFTSARHAILLGFISSFLTSFMGVIDWLHFRNGSMSTTITLKLILSATLAVFLLATLIVNKRVKLDSKLSVLFYAICVINVFALGLFGGDLVY